MTIHPHISRALLWYLVILIAATFAIWWLFARPISDDPVEQANQMEIKSFTLGGEVTAIGKDNITVKTGWVQDGKFVYYDRTIKITTNTEILSVTTTGTFQVENKDRTAYFRIGDKVTIRGDGNPYQKEVLEATKIEVQRQ